jgi:hypothetical protein
MNGKFSLFKKVTDVSNVQEVKAPWPMDVTELGMVTEVSLLQRSKAR